MAQDDNLTGLTPIEYLASGLAGLGAGAVAAGNTIRNHFWERIVKVPEIAALREQHSRQLEESATRQMENPQPRADYFKEIDAIRAKQEVEIAEKLEKLGYRSKGLTGLWMGTLDRARAMSHFSRNQVVLSGAITTLIGAAGTSMFFGSLHNRKNLEDIERKLDALEQKNQAR